MEIRVFMERWTALNKLQIIWNLYFKQPKAQFYISCGIYILSLHLMLLGLLWIFLGDNSI